MSQIGIRLARGHVVVRVVADGGKVGSPHRLAQQADSQAAGGIEQLSHEVVAMRGTELIGDEPGRGIGERSAEAVDLLVALRVVYGDREVVLTRPAAGPRGWMLFLQKALSR